MGLVAEAKYNAEQSLDFNRRDLKTKKEELENLKSQKIKPEEIEGIIESKDRENAGPTAPAHGLTLMEIRYI